MAEDQTKNMKKAQFLRTAVLISILLLGCNDPNKDLEKWKAEIVATEKAFNDMAQEEGLANAFAFYAADDGVIKRNNTIIQGKEAIRARYENNDGPEGTLTWAPTFVDVSRSGDLAYTYGDYTFTYPDSLGNMKSNAGIFHTVWKRQTDGTWRFVWD